MKKLLLTLLLLTTFTAFGQVTFLDPNTSWKALSEKALKEQKLIFVQLETSECEQCREVATQGLSGPAIQKKFDTDFVSIRLDADSDNGRDFARKLGVRTKLISLFADAEGNVLARFVGSTSTPRTYLDQADLALSKKGEKSLSQYKKEFSAGERSNAFMRGYIAKVKEAMQPYDLLLDEYVLELPEDSLQDLSVLKSIYLLGPSIGSDAYGRIIKTVPREKIMTLYKTATPAEAVAMNRGIIENTFRSAVLRRDENLAFLSADFLRQSYAPDLQRGQFAFESQMVKYFQGIRDTARYVDAAKQFLGTNHMQIPLDSLKAMDDRELQKMKPVPARKDGIQVMTFAVTNPSQFYHIDLNHHAMYFYEHINNKADLETALTWSAYSMKLYDELTMGKRAGGNANYEDTYARLLYKLNRRDEAVTWQEKAIASQKAMGMPHGSFETTLQKMKAGTL